MAAGSVMKGSRGRWRHRKYTASTFAAEDHRRQQAYCVDHRGHDRPAGDHHHNEDEHRFGEVPPSIGRPRPAPDSQNSEAIARRPRAEHHLPPQRVPGPAWWRWARWAKRVENVWMTAIAAQDFWEGVAARRPMVQVETGNGSPAAGRESHLAEAHGCSRVTRSARCPQFVHYHPGRFRLAQASAHPRFRRLYGPRCGELHPSAARPQHHALEPGAGARPRLPAAPGPRAPGRCWSGRCCSADIWCVVPFPLVGPACCRR